MLEEGGKVKVKEEKKNPGGKNAEREALKDSHLFHRCLHLQTICVAGAPKSPERWRVNVAWQHGRAMEPRYLDRHQSRLCCEGNFLDEVII